MLTCSFRIRPREALFPDCARCYSSVFPHLYLRHSNICLVPPTSCPSVPCLASDCTIALVGAFGNPALLSMVVHSALSITSNGGVVQAITRTRSRTRCTALRRYSTLRNLHLDHRLVVTLPFFPEGNTLARLIDQPTHRSHTKLTP